MSVSIPKPFPQHAAFYKVAKRALDDISTVAAAYAVTLDRRGRVAHCRLRLRRRRRHARSACTRPKRRCWGARGSAPAVRDAQRAIAAALRPMSDHRGSAEYRLAVAQTLLEKFFWETQQAEAA